VGGYHLPEHALFCDPGNCDARAGPFLSAGGDADEAQSDSHLSPFPRLEHDPNLSLIPDMVTIVPRNVFSFIISYGNKFAVMKMLPNSNYIIKHLIKLYKVGLNNK
jgi:hypothetical protein